MKNKLYLILAGLFLLTMQVKAQSPNSFNYQGVARDASGNVLATQAIGLEFTIHQGSAGGTIVYEETQSETTNQFGLFTVAIGTGTVVTGTFSGIGWGANGEYLEVAMDPTGGTSYADMGTQQLLSVPYALYAASSGSNYTAGTGVSITDGVINANTTDALWNANQLQGNDVSNTAPTTGQVLQWSGATWAPATFAAGGNGWNLTGNSGTTYGTDFIGTTDDQGLQFKMNGSESGRIEDANSGGGYNTSLGYQSLYMNTYGSQSAALGYGALYSNQYSINNVAVGYEALYNNDNDGLGLSDYNTAVGNSAMLNNIDGTGSTALGANSLSNSVTSASYNNTAIGYQANIASDGLYNATAIGYNATVNSSNTVQLGSGCSVQFDQALMPAGDPGTAGDILESGGAGAAPTWVAAGGNSAWGLNGNAGTTYGTNFIGTTDDEGLQFDIDGTISGKIEDNTYNANTALGCGSLQSSSGVRNAAFGFDALSSNTGSYNVAFGSTALLNNHTPSYNTAVGAQALYYNDYWEAGGSTASNNTAVGGNASEFNTEGSNNTSVGKGALNQSHLGNNNTAMGYQALYNDDNDVSGIGNNNTAVGDNAMYNTVDGAGNTALGMNALNNSQNSNNNTAIGYNADISSDGLNNATAIGYNAIVSASNTVQLGNGCNVQFDDALMPAGNAGTSGEVLQSNGAGTAPTWVTPSGGGSSTTPLTLFTPTNGDTINLIVGTNIISPSASLNTLYFTMPSSPTNGQCVELFFIQNVSNAYILNATISYLITNAYFQDAAGQDSRIYYVAATSTWY